MCDGTGIIGGPLALGGGGLFGSHNPKCFNIFFITSACSMALMIRIFPLHCGQTRGSTLQFFFINLAQSLRKLPGDASDSIRDGTWSSVPAFFLNPLDLFE